MVKFVLGIIKEEIVKKMKRKGLLFGGNRILPPDQMEESIEYKGFRESSVNINVGRGCVSPPHLLTTLKFYKNK